MGYASRGKQLGGAPANFAFHASQTGMHGIVLSAIGFDSLGAETYDMLVKLNLDNILIDSDLPTSTVNVAIDANGIPHYEITEMWHGTNLLLSGRSRR